MVNINHSRAIIFDCDGVLFNSNTQKSDAFGKVLEGYPAEQVKSFVKYHKETGGVSRYVKFRKFFEEFLNHSGIFEEEYQKVLESFSEECISIYKNSELTPGALELLQEIRLLGKPMYVASGSDENELQASFELRGIDSFFNGIYGSPKTKAECVDKINESQRLEEAIFIGDSMSDYSTAKSFGMKFIFMKKYTEMNRDQIKFCEQEADLVIDSLQDLL
ncbi:HAD family hydrolase [Rossellomorea vietnamensis]|uniref:HAD family hydrolase n=1 Tax=Rossellomorea vietnamensis TaxID=218284 RepID=A0A5D4M4C8_9BACI|nr:HAD-IA family hydrolase [Rossellomorea vietnamensis]TYR95915.1 HAD family hydrolase [Rossellomorea vietnamensis]